MKRVIINSFDSRVRESDRSCGGNDLESSEEIPVRDIHAIAPMKGTQNFERTESRNFKGVSK